MSGIPSIKMNNKPKKNIPSKIPTSGRDSGTHSRSSSVSNLTTASDLHSEVGDAASDNSEDFKIDERVWVNGTKAGVIKFIGKTEFAPGIWAGVLLDEPVGKNDGSVSGVKYFSCEPMKGIFARHGKLSRTAGAVSGIGDSPMIGNVTPRSTNMQSGRSSVCSNVSSPIPKCTKLKIGDRVTVSSLTGLKPGTLRFIGETEFAKGEWAGIELDEPTGKNDGSVAGKKYFSCQMKYGLFAPLHKVSRPGASPVSRPGSVRGTPIFRSSSRDSLNSSVSNSSRASRVRLGITSLSSAQKSKVPGMGVSNATKAFEEAIKEKDLHIDQLLKERELDRTEFARLANHFEQIEAKSDDLEKKQAILESDKKSVEEQLMTLKKKHEDIQFQLEEEKIAKTDFEVQLQHRSQVLQRVDEFISKETGGKFLNIKEILSGQEALSEINQITSGDSGEFQIKIADLEKSVKSLSSENQELVNQLTEFQNFSGKLSSEAESEITNLKTVIQEKDDMIANLKHELNDNIEKVTQLIEDNKCLNEQMLKKEEQAKGHADDVIKELGEKINSLSEQLKTQSSQLGEQITSVEEKDNKIKTLEHNLNEQAATLLQLQNENINVSDALKIKEIQYEENVASQKSLEETITALKSQLETVNGENQEKIKLLEDEIKNKSGLLENYLSSIEQKENLITSLQVNFDSQAAAVLQLQNEKKDLNDLLKQRESELSEKEAKQKLLEEQLCNVTSQSESSKTEIEKELSKVMNEKEILSCDIKEKEASLLEKENMLLSLENKLKEKDSEISDLLAEKDYLLQSVSKCKTDVNELKIHYEVKLSEKQEELLNMKSDVEKLSGIINEKDEELRKREEYIISLESKLKETETEISNLSLQNADLHKNISKLSADIEESQKMLNEKLCSSSSEFDIKLKEKDIFIRDIENQLQKSTELLENKTKDLNSKEEELNVLKNIVKEKDSQFAELNKIVESSQNQLALIKEQNEKNESLLQTKELFIDDFKVEQEKHLLLKEQTFKEETSKLEGLISSKDEEINSKQIEISNLLNEVRDKTKLVESLQIELEAAKADERKIHQELNNRIVEIEEKYTKLVEEKEKITKEEMQTRDAKKNLENVRDKLLQEKSAQEEIVKDREAKLAELQAEINRMEVVFTQHKQELLQKLDVNEMEQKAALELKNQLDVQRDLIETLQQNLNSSEAKCKELEEEVTKIPVITSQKNELLVQIDEFQKVNQEKCEMVTKAEKKCLALEEQFNNNKNLILEKEKELSSLRQQLKNISVEKMIPDNSSLKSLEDENESLKNKITLLELENSRNTDKSTKVSKEDVSPEEAEEREFLVSQVDFLNSIIVDLKQKNEELVRQLEAQTSGWDESDINLNETTKAIPPRLFCDICEMFDLHDTDDCPKQESCIDEKVPQLRIAGTRQMEERPYCNNCEVFGHWTLDCEEPDTF